MEEKKSIEEQAQATFLKNMAFFQTNHPDVFEKLTAFETAISKGYYTPKYELEYKDEGYFDVQEIETGRCLYEVVDSNTYAKMAVNDISYKKAENLFETFKQLKLSDQAIKKIREEDIIDSSLATAISIIEYWDKNFSLPSFSMKKLYKFIFLGTGLGTHLISMHEKIQANVYFIIEDDLELFYLSLFVTDYTLLTSHNAILIFSIFDEEKSFFYKTKKFLHEMFMYNHYLKFFLFFNHDLQKLQAIQRTIHAQDYLTFPHNSVMKAHLRAFEQIQSGYKYINLDIVRKKGFFLDKPILMLGAGPSLQKNLQWLKKNQDHFIIFSVTALMSTLEKENIVPDVLVHVDGFEPSMQHVEKVSSMDFFQNTLLFFASFTYPKFMKRFNKENVYMIQGVENIKRGFTSLIASNVGIMGLALSLYLRPKEVYLLGLDLALEPESGVTHMTDHAYVQKLDVNKKVEIGEMIDYKSTVFETEGNFRQTIPTTHYFYEAQREASTIVSTLKTDSTALYNLSDGAKIQDAIPLRIEEIEAIETFQKSEKVRLEFRTVCENTSEKMLTPYEIDKIRKRLKYAESVLSILESFKRKNYSSIDYFHYDLLGVFLDILADGQEEAANDTNNIITLYLKFISGYLFDAINTKEMDNPKKHMKYLKNEFVYQLERIVRYYRDYLEEFLNTVQASEA